MDTNFTHNLKKEPLTFKVDKDKRKALEMGVLSIGGFLTGLGTMALLGHSQSVNAASSQEYDETCEGDDLIDIVSDVPIAQCVSEDMTFDEAFAAARNEMGAGAFFNWHGRSYNTYYADEWMEMDVEEKGQYLASVEENASYKTYDYSNSLNRDTDPQNEIILADVDNDGNQDIKEVDLNNDGNIDVIHVTPEEIEVVEESSFSHSSNSSITEGELLEPITGIMDSDNNEVVDSLAYDKDMDGYADTVIIDINEDGYGDVAGLDTDLDGELDIIIVDEDQDGFDENDVMSEIDVEIAMDEFIIIDEAGEEIIQETDNQEDIISNEDSELSGLEDLDDSGLEMI